MNAKFALVTGGAGFIGSHIVDRLVSDGWNVRVLDNFSSGRMENIEHQRENRKVEILREDLKNLEEARKLVRDVDIVFHYAANPEVTLMLLISILLKEAIPLIKAYLYLDDMRFLKVAEKLGNFAISHFQNQDGGFRLRFNVPKWNRSHYLCYALEGLIALESQIPIFFDNIRRGDLFA
jgi:hypothetical protein